MATFTDAIGRALDVLAVASETPGFSKPWVLAFSAERTGVFIEARDVEMTAADETAEPLLALEVVGSAQEVRERFLAAWAGIPLLSDHHGRAVSAIYQDSLGMGSNEGGAGWIWQAWDDIE